MLVIFAYAVRLYFVRGYLNNLYETLKFIFCQPTSKGLSLRKLSLYKTDLQETEINQRSVTHLLICNVL